MSKEVKGFAGVGVGGVRCRTQVSLFLSLSHMHTLTHAVVREGCFLIVHSISLFLSLSPLCFFFCHQSVCLSSSPRCSAFLGRELRWHRQWRCWLPGRLPQQLARPVPTSSGEVEAQRVLCFPVSCEPRAAVPQSWGKRHRGRRVGWPRCYAICFQPDRSRWITTWRLEVNQILCCPCAWHGLCSISVFASPLKNFELNFSIILPLSCIPKSSSILLGYIFTSLFCYCNDIVRLIFLATFCI